MGCRICPFGSLSIYGKPRGAMRASAYANRRCSKAASHHTADPRPLVSGIFYRKLMHKADEAVIRQKVCEILFRLDRIVPLFQESGERLLDSPLRLTRFRQDQRIGEPHVQQYFQHDRAEMVLQKAAFYPELSCSVL